MVSQTDESFDLMDDGKYHGVKRKRSLTDYDDDDNNHCDNGRQCCRNIPGPSHALVVVILAFMSAPSSSSSIFTTC
jgi:hypothetical protein